MGTQKPSFHLPSRSHTPCALAPSHPSALLPSHPHGGDTKTWWAGGNKGGSMQGKEGARTGRHKGQGARGH